MLPDRMTALRLLHEAEALNPGPWVPHSLNVARAAEAIAAHHPRLDAERAFVLGALHDLGRRTGPNRDRHILDGYDALRALGFEDAARIALTHSFPLQELGELQGEWDGTAQEHARLGALLADVTYTLEDRLVQVCDMLALPDGCCILEKRFVDVTLRYGFGPATARKWRALLDLKRTFDAQVGGSVYALLPGIVETTLT
ncbi:HD domain-containing protein [Deinococcus maricopensis]|uniref:Metal-dependent phosphohydrolase HD sub domain protein n=1 Tax=Deinococcus maricopensis (strain DSM 21211 / LMG 22137 / NRRL B-23946 / LB-34) TaxID=709986 RepID=E8U4A7_DEIML|nr:HD domain-containing protein [Deinococcus maricopensis]ADV65944.1 metal-dependent phosphohydrolase HD sub domain protein [Deinococcus maricopensis DSM 21211]